MERPRPQLKRPFEDTKRFIEKVYEDAYLGEHLLPKSQIDFDKPYSQIGEKYYQEEFGTTVMGTGDKVPLVMMPVDSRPDMSTKAFDRRNNATLLYVFADQNALFEPYQSQEEIGELYCVTREQIRHDVGKSLADLHSNAGVDIEMEFPLGSLATNRPRTLSFKINQSESAPGVPSLQIHRRVLAGDSAEKIVALYGRSVINARATLSKWGLEAPLHIPSRDYGAIARKATDPNTTMEELRELIKQIDNTYMLKAHMAEKLGGVIISLADLQFEAWGNKNMRARRTVYQILEKAGMPVHVISEKGNKGRSKNYYITFEAVRQRALEILRENALGNMHIPVEQVAGLALEKIPNTNQLFGSKNGEWDKVMVRHPGIKNYEELIALIQKMGLDIPVVKYESASGKDRDLYIRVEDSADFYRELSKATQSK